MGVTELVGVITGSLTIVGAVVGVTRYVTQLQFKVKNERLETENELAREKINDLEARNREILNDVALAKRVGSAALMRKMEIEEDLSTVMRALQARAGSVYIPVKVSTTTEASGLVFLSILPFGQQAAKLKRKVIPMQSSAGRCFKTGKPWASPNPKADPNHFRSADLVSGYHTENMLNFPLRHRGEVVGVLQLLNREEPGVFTDSDIPSLEPFALQLAEKVSVFTKIPESLEILGVTQEREATCATVMFCDLTRSSILFQEMNVSGAIQHLNEYFERVCDTAMSFGATVDKYIGDGVLLRFNVPRRLAGHPEKAVAAAVEMIAEFEKLKRDWITMGEPLGNLYLRIGISYGEVHEAVVGHPQSQQLTVFGLPVNVAANLCEAAVRNENIVVIDENLHAQLSGKLVVEPLSRDRLGKAVSYVESAYVLRGLT
ncbi:MAG: hypothetical protein AKCLJLPJ_01285 [Fimbriimonadales bacterium]|nr:hypothetical protein [Fimbriimonadales bacterium]